MRRLLAVIVFLGICLSFTGCGPSVEERNREARAVLDTVLAKETSFTLYNTYIEETSEEILAIFSFPTYSSALHSFLPAYYTFVDADQDGVEELVVVDVELSSFLFLRYDREDDKVYGYMERFIAVPGFKTDGSFTRSLKDDPRVICSIAFDKTQFMTTEKAHLDEANGVYQIDGKDVDKAEVEKYFADWEQNTTNVQFTKHPDNVISIPERK